MKKTLTVNLNGRVFNIDEDAYGLLEKYLDNLRVYFRKEEGSSEIIADFEARIEELFSERVRQGYEVVTIEQVEKIIERMGKPEDFGDAGVEPETEQKKEIHYAVNDRNNKKKLYRDVDDKLFGGVCSGIAAYFDWDTVAVRIIILICMFASAFSLIPIYLIAWMIIPAAKTAEQKLKMRGMEVTVENIGKTIASETNPDNRRREHNFGESFLDFVVALIKICLIGFGILIGLPLILALLITIVVLFAVIFGVGGGLLALPFEITGTDVTGLTSVNPILAVLAFSLVIGIPLCSLIYLIVANLAKLNPMPKSIKWAGIVTWILALILLIYSVSCINIRDLRNGIFQFKHGNYDLFIEGDGISTTRTADLPSFQILEINDNLMFDVQLEPISTDSVASIFIRGDKNIIEQVAWSEEGGKLNLRMKDNHAFRSKNEVKIKITCSPGIKGVKMESLGNLVITRQLSADDFFLDMDGAGNIEADSLYCNSFRAEIDGLGSISAKGNTKIATLNLRGAGKIVADEMEAKEVNANLNGIGKIKCNPIEKLDARVNGIGKISYKNKPVIIHKGVIGLGKIKQE